MACVREPAPRDFFSSAVGGGPIRTAITLLAGVGVPKEDVMQDTHHPVTNRLPNCFNDLPRISGGVMRFDRERITQMQLLFDGSAIRFSPGQSLRVLLLQGYPKHSRISRRS